MKPPYHRIIVTRSPGLVPFKELDRADIVVTPNGHVFRDRHENAELVLGGLQWAHAPASNCCSASRRATPAQYPQVPRPPAPQRCSCRVCAPVPRWRWAGGGD